VGNVSKGDITSNKSYRIPHKIHQTWWPLSSSWSRRTLMTKHHFRH
jgi:hypothetical protein